MLKKTKKSKKINQVKKIHEYKKTKTKAFNKSLIILQTLFCIECHTLHHALDKNGQAL